MVASARGELKTGCLRLRYGEELVAQQSTPDSSGEKHYQDNLQSHSYA